MRAVAHITTGRRRAEFSTSKHWKKTISQVFNISPSPPCHLCHLAGSEQRIWRPLGPTWAARLVHPGSHQPIPPSLKLITALKQWLKSQWFEKTKFQPINSILFDCNLPCQASGGETVLAKLFVGGLSWQVQLGLALLYYVLKYTFCHSNNFKIHVVPPEKWYPGEKIENLGLHARPLPPNCLDVFHC